MRCGVCWIFVLLRDCKYTPKTEMVIRTHQATASHALERRSHLLFLSMGFPKQRRSPCSHAEYRTVGGTSSEGGRRPPPLPKALYPDHVLGDLQ